MNEHLVSIGLFFLRLAFGLSMLLAHGWPKLMKFGELADKFPDPLGMGSQLSLVLAIGAEVGCSVLLIIGLFTRLAAIPLAVTMIVAFFVVHGADPWKVKELAALYLAVYATLAFTGAGHLSVDGLIQSRKSSAGVD